MSMQIQAEGATDTGRKRNQNQDHIGLEPEMQFFVVADGMGGHQGGETASRLAVEQVISLLKSSMTAEKAPGFLAKSLAEAIKSAGRAIYQTASEKKELHGMGTTTVSALFHDDILTIGHVGDSRCYYINADGIWQLTRDHSMVQEKLRAGIIKREQVKTDRMKNVITRAVGFEAEVDVDIYEMEVQPGDHFLLCSDGLSGLIDDVEIYRTLKDSWGENRELSQTVKTLIQKANDNGGDDNISVILLKVME